MKNLLIFLFGAAVGAGGMLLWFRKDIRQEVKEELKEELKQTKNNGFNGQENDQEPPFTVGETNEKEAEIVAANDSYEPEKRAKVPYHTLFQGSEGKTSELFSDPRDSGIFTHVRENEDENDNPEAGFIGNDETNGGVFEIDKDDFMADDGYEQERLVYYRGDKIMATEDGTIVTNPFILVGGEWDKCVGNYADRTAFIRNPRLVVDYEIYVEDGLYSDEYGPPDGYREG